MSVSSSQLRELKARAQELKPTLRLGKAGVSVEFLKSLGEMLEKQGMVKVRFEAFKDERKTVAREIAEKSGSVLVNLIGHTAVYHRPASRSASVESEN